MIRTRVHLHSLEERLAPSVSLVADINRDLAGAYYTRPLVAVNDTVLFRSNANGGEVWRSDGTPAGTGPAGPGVQIGDEYEGGKEFAGAFYFRGSDPIHGNELWRTDGTPQGTRLVRDTFAGPSSGAPEQFTVAGNTLYFVANRNQLWRSDGTTAGTFPIRRLGVNEPFDGIQDLAAAGNRIYIEVNGIHDSELWTSDGSYAGTHRVTNLFGAGGHFVWTLIGAANGAFYFSAAESDFIPRLWVTDGTAGGTKMVRDDLTVTDRAAVLGGKLYFVAADITSGPELWVTDGTANGTTPVKDIDPTGWAFPEDLVVQGSYLYFTADDGTTGRELWRTDGTADGTIRLADLIPGPASSDPESLTPTAGGLYFTASTPTAGKEVWVTDGTPEGTVLVADLEPGPDSSFPTWLVSTGDRAFWVGNTRADGSSLWVADPTGATMLSQVPAATENSFARAGVTIGGVHYFVANDGDHGREVWRTDGTNAGTWMLKDIFPGPGYSEAKSLTDVDGTLYFVAKSPGAGWELWASDGTTDGTRMVKDIERGTIWSGLTASLGKVFFTVNTAGEGIELWVSDGTADGTQLVKDIYPGPGNGLPDVPRKFIELNGYLYFAAQDPGHGWEIWRTDGTETGTTLVTDLPAPWTGLSDGIWRPDRVGDRIVFRAPHADSGGTIWGTDGTAGGTASLGLYPTFGIPADPVVLGDRLLLWAKGVTRPNGLWVTDGTPAGTTLVRPGPLRGRLEVAGGLAYFIPWNNQHELWRTDGTPAGTFRLRTFTRPVGGLVDFNGQLYFVGHDLMHGYGLWTTDGTTAGTRFVKDLGIGQPYLFRLGGALFIEVTRWFGTWPNSISEHTLWRSDGTEAGTHPIAPDQYVQEHFSLDIYYYQPFVVVGEINGVALFDLPNGLSGNELCRYDPIATQSDHFALEDKLRLDVPAATGLLANDTDGGQPLTAKLLTKPKSGWLTLRPDGSFTYQPFSRDFSGTDSFTYRADAAHDQSLPTTVTIDVDLVNQAPVAENDTAAGRAGSPVTVRVLANDADPDNDTLTIASFTQGTSGRVSKVGNTLVYTARTTGALTDTFSYTVRDQRGATATATVTVNLTAQPMPKVAAVGLFPGPGTGSINLVAPGRRALPFQRLSRIEVTFSADVSVTADDLRLIGADGGSYSLSGFSYDSARRTASWVIDGPAAATWADRLTVLIDGSAATGVTGPGGVPIGDWAKTVSLLVGDFNGDGVVTATDRIAVRNRFGPVSGLTRLFADVDGNGVVDGADADLVMANLGGRRV